MANKRNKHLSYGIELELDFVCGKVSINEDNEHVRKTYIDAETLAKCSERSLIETVEFIEYGNKSLIDCLDMIVDEVKSSLSVEFEEPHITKTKNLYKGAWIMGNGDIVLHCNANVFVDVEMNGSNDSVDGIARLIKNTIKRAINGDGISVSYSVLY